MNERKFNWFVDHMPKPTKECPYYRNMLLVDDFFGYGPKSCAEDCEQDRMTAEKRKVDAAIKYFTSCNTLLGETEMSIERKNAIQAYANESGLTFADAKRMLEAIEADYDANDVTA